MSETLPLSSVTARLSELVDRVEEQQDRVVLTRNGKPVAVLVSPEDLESLEETLAILSDSVAIEPIRESERSLAAGEPTAEYTRVAHGRRQASTLAQAPQVTSTANLVRLPPMLGKMTNAG